jgi:hypothetical protein
MSLTVKLISAPWCKRCHEIKPDVVAYVAMAGATLEVVNFDELEEEDPMRAAVTSLPTILMQTKINGPWTSHTAHTLAEWKTAVLASAFVGTNTDF